MITIKKIGYLVVLTTLFLSNSGAIAQTTDLAERTHKHLGAKQESITPIDLIKKTYREIQSVKDRLRFNGINLHSHCQDTRDFNSGSCDYHHIKNIKGSVQGSFSLTGSTKYEFPLQDKLDENRSFYQDLGETFEQYSNSGDIILDGFRKLNGSVTRFNEYKLINLIYEGSLSVTYNQQTYNLQIQSTCAGTVYRQRSKESELLNEILITIDNSENSYQCTQSKKEMDECHFNENTFNELDCQKK